MSKNQNVVTPVTAKVELTVAELVVLINNSKKVELTAEQVAGCKGSMAAICQKFVTGEKITADENVIMQFVAGLTKKAIHAGQTEVEKAEAKVQAEKTFATDVQKFEIDLAVRFTEWSENVCIRITNEEDEKWNSLKIGKDALKVSFAEFIKGLPKKPGATKKEGSAKKESTRVANEPSVNSVVKSTLLTTPEISKQALLDILINKYPTRALKDVKFSMNNSLKALKYTFAEVAEEIAA